MRANRPKILKTALIILLAACACNLPFFASNDAQSAAPSGPAVTIQRPAPGAQFTQGDSFIIFATASDPIGVIRLDLWVDDTLILSQINPDPGSLAPLSLTYSLVAARTGDYTLLARAFNSQGEMGESVVHYVSVIEKVASTQEYAQFVVQEGDTLENIAQRLGVSVDDILQANPHIQGGQIFPGQVIVIPMPPKQPPQAAVPGPNGGVQPIAVPGGVQPGGGQPLPVPQKPPPVPPNPSTQIIIQNASISSNPVYYGKNCKAEPTILNITARVEPVASVSKAILAYAFINNAGVKSQDFELVMQPVAGEYKADVNIGQEADAHLAQDGGELDIRVEAYDIDNKLVISPIYTITVQFCAAQANLNPNLPGILPQFKPGAVPVPGVAQEAPELFPQPKNVLGPNAGAVEDPSDLKAVSTDGCKVTLTWNDNATDETGYEVHRLNPGQPHYSLIAQLKPDSSTYKDRTPSPGKYMYYVVAIRTINGVTSEGGSYNAMVDVTQTTNCDLISGPKRLMFQPINFRPNDDSISKAFVSVTLNGFSPIRVPRAEQDYLPVGDWSAAGEWAIPLPESVFSDPGDSLFVEVRGGGFTPTGPDDLRGFQRSHSYASLRDPAARNTNWSGDDRDAEFELVYRLWLDNWAWGGSVSDPSIPAPTNLLLDSVDPFNHNLSWDYDPKSKPKIDGFIVYGKYSCPYDIYDAHFVVVKNPGGKNDSDQKYTIQKHKQFTGCVCQYQVSAFTNQGESKLSSPTTGKCETGAPEANVVVTFNTFKMITNKPTSGYINLYTWQTERSTALMIFEGGREYDLQNLYFDGSRNNNRINISIPAGSTDSAAEYTVKPWASVSIYTCKMTSQDDIKFPAAAALYGDSRLFQLTGSCGPDCTCIINGKAEVLPPGQGGAQGNAPSGMVWKDIGEACASDLECASSYCKDNVCVSTIKGLNGATCFANDQCVSGICSCYYIGRPDVGTFPCSGIYNPFKSGSCVGPSNTDLANGEKCSSSYVCASGYCANGLCAPTDGTGRLGDYCHHNNHCSNHYCVCPSGYDGDFCKGYQTFNAASDPHGVCGFWPGAANGASCKVDNDCQSRHCADQKCAPITGTGLDGDYCHLDSQCKSTNCFCPDGLSMGSGFLGSGVPCNDYMNFTPDYHGTCR